jgi:LPS export ABC transporter protein LptC
MKKDKGISSPLWFFLILFILVSCGGNDLVKLNTISAKLASNPSVKSHPVRLVYSDSNRVKVILTSPLLIQYTTDKPYREMPQGVHIEFLNNEEKIVSTVDANYAIQYDFPKMVVTRKNVRVVNKDGVKLNTEELTWDQDKKKIFTDKYVKVTKPDGEYEGDGLDANEDFSRYSFRNFKGKVQMKNDSLFH